MANFIQSYRPINLSDIPRLAPNAAMAEKSLKRSSFYTHVDTMKIAEFFVLAGLIPVYAAQSSKKKTKEVFNPFEDEDEVDNEENDGWHKISLMKKEHAIQLLEKNTRKGSVFPMVSITNAHNGLHSLNLSAGILRQICNNGLSVTNSAVSYGARHTEDLSGLLDEAQRILTGSEEVAEMIYRGKNKIIDLRSDEYKFMDGQMVVAKYGEDSNYVLSNRLYIPSHAEGFVDGKVSPWDFFNDRQEALTKGIGNMTAFVENKRGESVPKQIAIRGIKAPKKNHETQTKFWEVYSGLIDQLG